MNPNESELYTKVGNEFATQKTVQVGHQLTTPVQQMPDSGKREHKDSNASHNCANLSRARRRHDVHKDNAANKTEQAIVATIEKTPITQSPKLEGAHMSDTSSAKLERNDLRTLDIFCGLAPGLQLGQHAKRPQLGFREGWLSWLRRSPADDLDVDACPKDIAALAEMRHDAVRQLVLKMAKDGEIHSPSRGLYSLL